MRFTRNCPYCGANYSQVALHDGMVQGAREAVDRDLSDHMQRCKYSPKAIAESQEKEKRRAEYEAEKEERRRGRESEDSSDGDNWGAIILGFLVIGILGNIYEWFISLHWFFQGLIGLVILLIIIGLVSGGDEDS